MLLQPCKLQLVLLWMDQVARTDRASEVADMDHDGAIRQRFKSGRRERFHGSDLRQNDLVGLPLVLAVSVFIAGRTGFATAEQQLANALAGINATVGTR